MADAAAALRALAIKAQVFKRLQKELAFYEKEREGEQRRVDAMRAAGADVHDLRQAENVLAESAAMVPETRQRLEAAASQLQAALAQAEQDLKEGAPVPAEVEAARAANASGAADEKTTTTTTTTTTQQQQQQQAPVPVAVV